MVSKRIVTTIVVFGIVFLPFIALSFLAHTVYHQIILLLSGLGAAWFSYYVSNLMSEQERLNREVFLQAYELKKSKEALEACLVMDTQTHVYNERLLQA